MLPRGFLQALYSTQISQGPNRDRQATSGKKEEGTSEASDSGPLFIPSLLPVPFGRANLTLFR